MRKLIFITLALLIAPVLNAQIASPVPGVQALYDNYSTLFTSNGQLQSQVTTLTAQVKTQSDTLAADTAQLASNQTLITSLQAVAGQISAPTTVNWFVDGQTGADTGDGSVIHPFKTIMKAVAASSQAKPVILIWSSTYNEHLIFKDYDDVRGVGIPIIDGKNSLPILAEGGQHVSIRGIRFTGAASPALSGAVKPNSYWLMESCEVDHCSQAGLDPHGTSTTALIHDFTLRHLLVDHNGVEGLKGGFCQGTVDSCEICFNNTSNAGTLGEAGGGKFAQSNGMKFFNSYWHDNNGAGLWFDWGNVNYLVDSCYFGNNKGASGMGVGAVVEISQGPGTFIRCRGFGNGDSDLGIFESSNVTIQDCRINSYLRNNKGRADNTNTPISIKNISYVNCSGGIPAANPTLNVIVK